MFPIDLIENHCCWGQYKTLTRASLLCMKRFGFAIRVICKQASEITNYAPLDIRTCCVWWNLLNSYANLNKLLVKSWNFVLISKEFSHISIIYGTLRKKLYRLRRHPKRNTWSIGCVSCRILWKKILKMTEKRIIITFQE